MDATVTAHLGQGLALGGVLAVAAAWSRGARSGPVPHLGVGALGGVAVALGGRLEAVPPWLGLLLVMGAGAACGRLAWVLDQRVGRVRDRAGALPDLVVLGAAVTLVGVLVPAGVTPVGAPPLAAGALASGAAALGGTAALPGTLGALALGGAVALWLSSARGAGWPPAHRWALAGGALAGAAVLAGGALVAAGQDARATLLAGADPVGLAVRAAAAALAGRGRVGRAALAGVALGLVEALSRLADPTGAILLVPTVGVVLVSVILAWDDPSGEPAQAGQQ